VYHRACFNNDDKSRPPVATPTEYPRLLHCCFLSSRLLDSSQSRCHVSMVHSRLCPMPNASDESKKSPRLCFNAAAAADAKFDDGTTYWNHLRAFRVLSHGMIDSIKIARYSLRVIARKQRYSRHRNDIATSQLDIACNILHLILSII